MQSGARFCSLNEAYPALIQHVLASGHVTSPRGLGTTEIIGTYFTISDPRSRLLTSRIRKWSLPLALGELCWHLRGDDNITSLAYYAKAWEQFTDDGTTVSGSCYGKKLFSKTASGLSVWDKLKSLLTNDPQTRRAAVSFLRDGDRIEDSRDISCVISIQFILRNGYLDMFTNMRSNDLYLGLPYDVFVFSFLQELMCIELGCRLGKYHHHAASLHIYDRHLASAKAIASEKPTSGGRMQRLTSRRQIEQLLATEASLRCNGSPDHEDLDDYNRPLARELERYRKRLATSRT
ncbi:thymidylate synthase [Phyllobacterium phragmitis]|uniref:thymidylate synthase n=1 Tax=Phyllobacterium phragmitis TaxID=2670329 RepID=UPI0038B3E7D5